MNTIQAAWEKYQQDVMPKDASTLQRVETKRAFYAGAQAVLGITWNLSAEDVSEDAACAVIEGLHQETRQFVADVDRGRA